MHVVHIITRMIVGGAQENTLFTCEDLARDFGDRVTLLTGPSLGPEGSLLDRAPVVGTEVELVPELIRPIRPLTDAYCYRKLKRRLRALRPDVVHTHSAKAGILGRLAAWAAKVPVVVHTVHGAPFYAYQNPLVRSFYRRCERLAAARCHRLISVADAMTDLLADNRVAPREKFVTIYSGMDVEPFARANEHRQRVRARFGFRDDQIVVGKIARLFHLKGHDDLLAAAEQVLARCPQVHFLLVGDGILREPLQRRIAERGMAGHFHFAGLVPPSEIPALLGAMDLLVHTSLREGLARALPQALIAGKPVVSFDIDGAREVCRTGETGFLVPPREIDQLAAGILALATDPRLRESYGAAGRRLFTEQFRHQNMTRQIRAVYQAVAAEAQSSAICPLRID